MSMEFSMSKIMPQGRAKLFGSSVTVQPLPVSGYRSLPASIGARHFTSAISTPLISNAPTPTWRRSRTVSRGPQAAIFPQARLVMRSSILAIKTEKWRVARVLQRSENGGFTGMQMD